MSNTDNRSLAQSATDHTRLRDQSSSRTKRIYQTYSSPFTLLVGTETPPVCVRAGKAVNEYVVHDTQRVCSVCVPHASPQTRTGDVQAIELGMGTNSEKTLA